MQHYFVIDTDTYAGNFERELCAYITGCIGDCGVGDKIVDKLDFKLDFDELVGQEPDEHGCHRPVKIYPTPNIYNNGMGFEYRTGEEDEAQEAYKERWLELSTQNCYTREEDNENRRLECIERSKEPIGKHPAYCSVAIVMHKRPDDYTLKILADRARNFAQLCDSTDEIKEEAGISKFSSGFNITGFRFVTERTVTDEETIEV